MKGIKGLLLTLGLLAQLGAAAESHTDYFKNETPEQRAKRLEWFNEARFGLFIHWGVYAVPAGEWQGKTNYGEWFLEETKMPVSQYEKFAGQFNPVKFDAKEWVRMAKDAGMKYIVITSKHHDGFGMFRSTLTDWCIKATPFPRDPLKELAAACKAAGIKLCFYHSIMDWHHPDWGTRRPWNDTATGTPEMDRYVAYMKGQLKELLTGYGPIGIVWFDGEWEKPWTHERGVDLYNYVRNLQPKTIVNNRVGKGRSGMGGMDKGEGVGDYGTPEQEIPATGFGPGVTWESCMTMNGHWGYNKNDHNWKSAATLVRNLIDCASKGGNYLLNVGPTSEGLIPDASIERLATVGRWMKANHEAIYDTAASPFPKLGWGRCTKKVSGKETTLYLHVFNWPADGKLIVPGLKSSPRRAYLLADRRHQALATSLTADGLCVAVPGVAPDSISTTVVLKLRGDVQIEQVGLRQAADGTITLPANEAKLRGGDIRLEGHAGEENIGYWTNPEDSAEWQFKVMRSGKFEIRGRLAAFESSAIEIRVNQQRVLGKVTPTNDWRKFEDTALGTIELPVGDQVMLTVHATREQWRPVNLSRLILHPAS